MKKKIFALLIALLVTVNAYCYETGSDISEANTPVVYHVDSDYCITIPDVVVADGTEYRFTAPLMDLCDGEHVEISIGNIEGDGNIQMFSSSGKWALVTLHTNKGSATTGTVITSFYNGMTETADYFWITPEMNEGAGDYNGNVVFNINLVKE